MSDITKMRLGELSTEWRDRVAEATGLWLFQGARPCQLPGHSFFELYVGDAAMDLEDTEIAAAFRMLLTA